MAKVKRKGGKSLPETFRRFGERFPAVAEAHEAVAREVDGLGPLDRKTCQLIKIRIAAAAGLETATRSHARRAIEQGATTAEIEQTILLLVNTCRFPRAVAAWQWASQAPTRKRK
jgi:alkylhydroperoxidase/carboxymuconolactone decarboxylase family protein YurZ